MSSICLSSLDDVAPSAWRALAEKRIFFGHQSVGDNIMQALAEIVRNRSELELNIAETLSPDSFGQPLLAHAKVGRNREPLSKLDSFREILDSGVGDQLDIAMLKLCFIDVDRDADPQELFDAYRQAMMELEQRYPHLVIVHCSLPLWSRPLGFKKQLKGWAKALLGRPGPVDDNLKRAECNSLVKEHYGAQEAFFDIALLESMMPHGAPHFVRKGGAQVPMMARENTSDGGHLNARGSKLIAEQLLILLARLADK